MYGFENVVSTAGKMLKVAKLLEVPVIYTEQNPKALGPTVPELSPQGLESLHLGTFSKTLFSMAIPEVKTIIDQRDLKSIVLFGIESHVCILQSTLDLLALGYDVHILADGVSSTNKEEIPIALERMRQAGAQITTSESLLFQLQKDSSLPTFKPFANIIKEEKDATTNAIQTLSPFRSAL